MGFMKTNYFLFAFLFLFLFDVSGQEFSMVGSNSRDLVLQNTTPNYVSVKKSVDGILYENFNSVSKIKMMEKNAPELPTFSESVIIPDQGAVSIEITYGDFEEFDNSNILPSKGSLKRNIDPASVPYEFGSAYQANTFFPGKLAESGNPFIFRNTRGVTITFYPYQYNPATKKLRVYKTIAAKIIINTSATGINEKTTQRTIQSDSFQSFYQNLFINADPVGYAPINEVGEMLIIIPNTFVNTIQPLLNWKSESGIKTTVVTLATTGTTAVAIKNYIFSFYAANPNLAYVLLAGDHQHLPSYSYGLSGSEQLWSDSFYGQLEGIDYFPEVMVGRLSGYAPDVQSIISKIIRYETNPLAGDWMTKAIGIGSNEGYDYGDDGEADWQHLRNIGDKLSAFGYSNIYEFYDASQGGNDADDDPTAGMISDAINEGAGLLNYTGHGALEVMATGNYTSYDVMNSLNNAGKFPFVVSVACNNGTFVGGTSLCESFLTARTSNVPLGAIASCGSSILMAWAEPMQTQDEMAELIVRSNPSNIKNSLGGLFYNGQISMLEAYNQSITAQEVMQTWVFFGDPSIVFRNAVSNTITATHEETIAFSGGTLNVFSNTPDAKVVIAQENIILSTSYIEEGTGFSVITLPELLSLEPLKVTITKPNATPYRGTVTVTDNLSVASFDNQFVVYPNPVSDVVFIRNTGNAIANATITVTDINGRILMTKDKLDLISEEIALPALASGMYLLSIADGQKVKTIKMVVQ